ncbi:alpha-ribazole phosphatase [Variibacter gotjawalensis]|uniref:Alpha-ribazole phosphatase n=1 Tax=Variibacter gotjawalensis TaxID=1333996 RepID=A0A0S3PS97_9BRAD|nr:histidine phosphatase family protein [Variibacter gotjawalensis]NIK49134.1 broad specificity phosphatase PhoE [Variibacter gotjawalensis]RZS50990.1 putative phosphoglycerate mutase [Variibacter gotjawalensis]BAT58824.1 alpha-ribazole phosphatase [Variibacter gotjawalensis]
MPTRKFLFIRHGETDWNKAGRIQGSTDIPLNATGRAQARAAAAALRSATFDRVIASPLSRALETAQLVNEPHGRPLHTDKNLQERGFGSFEGFGIAELKQRHGIPMTQSLTTILPPDAEQWGETLKRTRGVIRTWTERYPKETLLFVSHGGVFGALHEQLCGAWASTQNAVPYSFSPNASGWDVAVLEAATADLSTQ